MDGKLKEDNKLLAQLITATTTTIILFLIMLGIFIISDNLIIYRNLLMTVFAILIGIFSFVIVGTTMILFSKPNKKTNPLLLKWMKVTFTIFYPLIYMTGCLIGIEKDRIRGEFAQINNYLVSKEKVKVHANEILILTPHCIQWADCPHKITTNIQNCKMCGKCKVKDLIKLSGKYGTQLVVVTGGTLARNTIVQKKPKAIVAIACERDLSNGIQDVKIIPVLGVVNERPEGPCHNTRVDIQKVEEAILYFLNGGEE